MKKKCWLELGCNTGNNQNIWEMYVWQYNSIHFSLAVVMFLIFSTVLCYVVLFLLFSFVLCYEN